MTHLLIAAIRVGLLAQQPLASVAGSVSDGGTGRPLVGAEIALPDLARLTTTDSAGHYRFRQVPAGPNHLVVRRIGYAPRTIHALVPSSGQLDLSIALRAFPIRLRTLVVRAAPVVRGLEAGEVLDQDRIASMAAARSHPLLAELDAFLALSGGPVHVEPESPSGVHVRGGASDHTAYQIDGIPLLSPYHAAGLFGSLNPDALASVRLASTARAPDHPDALAGVIAATTRVPGLQHKVQGSVSTGQARVTVDGPLGPLGAGYLASIRTGFPAAFAPAGDASHLRGKSGDWLAKLETPLIGGRLTLLGTGSDNKLGAAAVAEPGGSPGSNSPRHGFEWRNRSLGFEWHRVKPGATTRLVGWSAASRASAQWVDSAAPLHLVSSRSDFGVLVAAERRIAGGTTTGGLRLEARNVQYRTAADSLDPGRELVASTPLITGFGHHRRAIGDRLTLTIGTSVAMLRDEFTVSPSVSLLWRPASRLGVTASWARFRQFTQSARNGESIVERIFPVDLYLSAGAPGVPVARSDQGVVTIDYRPSAAIRVTAEAYQRNQHGLLLVAPRDGRPFTAGGFAVGSGVAGGASLDAAVSTAHFGVLLSYGIEQVRFRYGDSSYVPGYGATHRLEGGLIVFPDGASSVRIGVDGAWGRRGTGIAGGFEWEACNLIDRGCELAGSPTYAGSALGGTRLPHYFRVDLGFRHHWHLHLAGRDVQLGLFGSITNLLGRKNILTYATDTSTGATIPIEMRPFAPLVIGLDWRF